MTERQNNEMYHFRYVTDIFVPASGISQDEAAEVADTYLGQLLEDESLAFDDIFRIRTVRNAEHYVDEEFAVDVCFSDGSDADEEEDEEDEFDDDEEEESV